MKKILIIIMIIVSSCSLIDNEKATDEKFVGMWKYKTSNLNELTGGNKDMDFYFAQGLNALSKVPNTKEAYSFAMTSPTEQVLIFNKKDANTLISEVGVSGTKKLFYTLEYTSKETMKLTFSSIEGKTFVIEYSKVK